MADGLVGEAYVAGVGRFCPRVTRAWEERIRVCDAEMAASATS